MSDQDSIADEILESAENNVDERQECLESCLANEESDPELTEQDRHEYIAALMLELAGYRIIAGMILWRRGDPQAVEWFRSMVREARDSELYRRAHVPDYRLDGAITFLQAGYADFLVNGRVGEEFLACSSILADEPESRIFPGELYPDAIPAGSQPSDPGAIGR